MFDSADIVTGVVLALVVWWLNQRGQDKERRYQDRRAQIDRDVAHWAALRAFHIDTLTEVQGRQNTLFELTYQAYQEGMRNPRPDPPNPDEQFEIDSPQYRLFQEVAEFRRYASRLGDTELRESIQALEGDLVRVAFFGRYRTPFERAQTRIEVSLLGIRHATLNRTLGALISRLYDQRVPGLDWRPPLAPSPTLRYRTVAEHRGPLAGVIVSEIILRRRQGRTLPRIPLRQNHRQRSRSR